MARGSFRGQNVPTQVSAVSAWLRLAHGTIAGSGYSSIPDMLNVNPAIQTTDARRPVNQFSNNGLPIATFTDDFLSWPLTSANNGTVRLGFATWIRPTNTGEILCILSGAGMASSNKFRAISTTTLRCDAYPEDRHAESTALTSSAWQFVTIEIDCSKGTEATQVIHTVNTVVQSVSFSSGTPWPSSLPDVTGNMLIGAVTASAAGPFRGSFGPNFFWLSRQLTAPERTILMNFEQPT